MDFSELAQGSLDLRRYLTEESSSTTTATTPIINENRPLLSPSAEAELYLLASNFLLYVAMVIITTFIAKIYFPSCLESRHQAEEHNNNNTTISRSHKYKMVVGGDGQNRGIVLDLEEDNDDDESESDGGEFEDEYLDSGDEGESSYLEAGNSSSTTTRPTMLEFDQDTMSRAQVLKRLLFCTLMLNVTFVTWGVLQERMLTQPYDGEYFTYSYALVFTNRCWTFVLSGILLLYFKPHRSRSTIIYEYTFPSISNMLSSWCQYEALQYVTFPALTLFKSFKLAPVMAMGKLLGNKTYPTYDYFVALVIGIGITMFMTSTGDLKLGYDVYGNVSPAWTGILLLFLFLFFDSFTSQWQSRMFQRHRDLSMLELMFATSAFSTMLSFVTLVHDKELEPAYSFAIRNSEIQLHFLLFSICSTIGQIFIFYTIKNFGAVVFTIIMTTRILLSIALSCVLYGHTVTGIGNLGLMIVMGAILYRIKRKAEGKILLKWQGIDDDLDKAQDLVQEWHEHVDM